MYFLAFLILLSALAIAGCAAYFSIVGLTLLFVGAGVSIVVMGAALEVGKVIVVTFLHHKWNEISAALKIYLIFATLIALGPLVIYQSNQRVSTKKFGLAELPG